MFVLLRLAIALALAAVAPGPAAALDIVALGASNTAGWGVGADNAFPARLRDILKARGIDAKVASAGIPGDTTGGMLRRIESDVPAGTDIVVLQPGTNDMRFFGTRAQRAANIAAIVERLRRRNIRVLVLDPELRPELLQWDGIHYTAAAHARFAATLAAQIAAGQKPAPKSGQKKPDR